MSNQGYEIKPVGQEDVDDVLNFIRRTFYLDEPLNQAVALCVDGICTELDDYCASGLRAGVSFKAVDKEGNVVGTLLNEICSMEEAAGNGQYYISKAEQCKNPKFQRILYLLAQREEEAKIFERFPHEENYLDVKIAATDPNWRKKGIMNELLNVTEKLCLQRGVKLLRLDCSSAYSAMAAERLGFTCISSIPYLNIKMDGRPIIVPEKPHVDDKVYVKLIS